MMTWSDGAEAKFRQERRTLGLDAGIARVLRTFIERATRAAGKTIVEAGDVKRLTAKWEGDDDE